jgi:cytochrome c-type biogenesis protein CcmH
MVTSTKHSRRILVAWVVLVLVAVVSVGYAIANTPSTSAAGRIVTLEKEVRCPSCGNLAVYNSKSASSYSIADYIQHEVHDGASNEQIIDSLVASYGDTILMAPPANGVGLFLWLLPIVVGLVLAWEVYRSLSSRARRSANRERALAHAPMGSSMTIDVAPGGPKSSPGIDARSAAGPLEGVAQGEALDDDQVGAKSAISGEIDNLSEGGGERVADAGDPARPQETVGGNESPSRTSARSGHRPLFSRRLAQIGAALILVGAGALGTLLLTRSGSTTAPSLSQELASGEALAGLGAVKQARTEFDHVLATYPSDPTALAYVGWIDFNLAKTKSAKADSITILARAAQLGAYDASAQLYYGLVLYYGEDKPVQAVDHLNRFLATHPSKTLVTQAYRLAKPAYLAAHRKIPNTF